MAFARLDYPTPGILSFYGTAAEAAGAGLVLTTIDGIGQAPIRAPIDDMPQGDGGIIHDFYRGPRHLTVEGLVLPFAYDLSNATAMWATMDSLVVALDSMLRQDGLFTWTPPGQTAHSLTVRCDAPATFNGTFRKTFIFGLVAADPTVAVA